MAERVNLLKRERGRLESLKNKFEEREIETEREISILREKIDS